MKDAYRQKIYKFTVPKYDAAQLVAKAVQHQERRYQESINLETIAEWSLNNILLNFIRHRMVEDYNKNCKSSSFQKNQEEYFEWFQVINREIGKQYPFLKSVVEYQINKKWKSLNDRSREPSY